MREREEERKGRERLRFSVLEKEVLKASRIKKYIIWNLKNDMLDS